MSRPVRVIAALAAILVLAAGGAAGWAWYTLQKPFHGYPQEEQLLEVRSGASATEILRQLQETGVLANAALARVYLTWFLGDPALKAGEYRFSGSPNTPEVLAKLVRGEVVTYGVTLIEGLTLEETADHLVAAGFGDREELLRAMRRPDLIADWDPAAEDLEGYLYPDTYQFARGTPAAAVVGALVANFRRQLAKIVTPRPGDADWNLRPLVTLASVVEKEARLDEERAVIAGVYANRLRIGMPLQADPTVIFALKRLGRWDGNLRRPDLQLDSPYNTYRYASLPPGPICSPGSASLAAAADPAEIDYLYFVSRNDGSHVFARTLAEHNRNVYVWQKQYWRRRWAEERAARDTPN